MAENSTHLRIRRVFYLLIHLVFLSGFLYSLFHFVRTPRVDMVIRRLWAYESWIILSFYGLFVYLILTDSEYRQFAKMKRAEHMARFKRVLKVNLILLVVPWGLFLLAAPGDLLWMLGLWSFYWRILGFMSLLGALIYFFPYRFYKHRLTLPILIFGAIDNFAAATIVMVLFFQRSIPLSAFSAVPLLFYFSFFFYEQARRYKLISTMHA